MAKEFDIYLRDRVHQCDLIVYSLPYRASLSAEHRLILESCVREYKLQKFLAIKTGSEIVSHIDRMLKTCMERLNDGAIVGSQASFTEISSPGRGENNIVVGADDFELYAQPVIDAANALLLAVQPLAVYPAKPVGNAENAIEMNAEVVHALKESLEQAETAMLANATIDGIDAESYAGVESDMAIDVDTLSVYRLLFTVMDTSLALSCACLGTETTGYSGAVENGFLTDAHLIGEHSDKFEALEKTVQILSEVTEMLFQMTEPSEDQCIELGAEMNTAITRYRRLEELDDLVLSEMDGSRLDDLDFVTLG